MMSQIHVNLSENFTNLYLPLSILEFHEAMEAIEAIEAIYVAANNIAVNGDKETD
jgi:hypothetical protein